MKAAVVLVAALACVATSTHGKVDPRCQAGCISQGFVQDFCQRSCTFDPEKGTIPAFGVSPAAAPAQPEPPAPPPEKKPQPPTASLEAFNPGRDALRDEVRRLSTENAALKKELATTRRTLENLQRKTP